MSYGQKNYLETQGINGRYRISQIGCFLTSFSNLLERFGRGKSPVELNAVFRDHGIYIDVDDGVKDDLYWGAITKYDGNIVVTRTGTGNPPSNNCIVKFTNQNNPFGTHFCLVNDVGNGSIVDSWDGQVKGWDAYGGPDYWAEYADNTPAPQPASFDMPAVNSQIRLTSGPRTTYVAGTTTKAGVINVTDNTFVYTIHGYDPKYKNRVIINSKSAGGNGVALALYYTSGSKIDGWETYTPPAPTAPAPTSNTVDIKIEKGWGISHALKSAGYTKEQWENPAEWQRVAELNGHPEGLRLNPGDTIKVYKTPLEIAKPEPVVPIERPQPSEDKVEVKVVPTDPNAYQATAHDVSEVYIAQESVVVTDMQGLHMARQLVKGQRVNGAQVFEKDGVQYVRTAKSVENDVWYGVPLSSLSRGQDPNTYVGPLPDDVEDDTPFDLNMAREAREYLHVLSGREKLVAILARVQGFFARVSQIIKSKKRSK